MHSNSNHSRVYRLTRWAKVADASGKCTHCRPHGGENATDKGNTKSKDRK